MRFPRSRYLGLFLVGCLLAALGWGLQTYIELVRLEASVVDTRDRVETASRVRLELVENLLHDARADGGAEALAGVELAATRVRELALLPAGLESDAGQAEFRSAQRELSSALDVVWDGGAASQDASVELAISDLRPEIQRWSVTLERGLAELDRQLGSFRASAAGFPGSLIAAIPRREGPAKTLEEPAAVHAEIAATVPEPVR